MDAGIVLWTRLPAQQITATVWIPAESPRVNIKPQPWYEMRIDEEQEAGSDDPSCFHIVATREAKASMVMTVKGSSVAAIRTWTLLQPSRVYSPLPPPSTKIELDEVDVLVA